MAPSTTWRPCARSWTSPSCARTSLSMRSRFWRPVAWERTRFCSCSRWCPTTSTASWPSWPTVWAWRCSRRSRPLRRCTGQRRWAPRSSVSTTATCARWPRIWLALRSWPHWPRPGWSSSASRGSARPTTYGACPAWWTPSWWARPCPVPRTRARPPGTWPPRCRCLSRTGREHRRRAGSRTRAAGRDTTRACPPSSDPTVDSSCPSCSSRPWSSSRTPSSMPRPIRPFRRNSPTC